MAPSIPCFEGNLEGSLLLVNQLSTKEILTKSSLYHIMGYNVE
jgi:hypothetical protein